MAESQALAALDQRTTEDDRRRLLEHFLPTRRAYVSNTYLEVVRAGARTPLQVLAAVNHNLRETIARAQRWSHLSDTVERTQDVLDVLIDYHDEAMAFASWAIWWQSLPQSERDRLKAEKGAEHREAYMQSQSATDKQRSYLAALGYHGEVKSKAEASKLIDQLRNGRQGGNRGN